MTVCIQCEHVSKQFGGRVILAGVDWTIEQGSLTGLLGSSGTGKTTLLRILAGLERCSAGRVVLPGGAGRRGTVVGMVFQNGGLWPHLTARRHVEFVLSSQPRRERRRMAERLLTETRLPPSAWDRRPGQLSGGEAQRVALARALALEPDLLLLDEPLSQLDLSLRAEMLALIRSLVEPRRVTVVYVTHSWPEVLELCPRLAVLRAGCLVQEGPTVDVFRHPADAHVARLTGPVCEVPDAWVQEGRIGCPESAPGPREGAVWLARPQQLRLAEPNGRNCWQVVQSLPHGNSWRLLLQADAGPWTIFAPRAFTPGSCVAVEISAW